MDTLLLVIAVIAFLFWVPGTVEMLVARFFIPSLERTPPAPDAECLSISIIVPACNEEATVEPAMRSLLALDYPALELIAVEDRSTDRTGELLDALAREDPRLHVIHVTELPEGWLGKNHALQKGAEAASGEWLLFTDADVHYTPDALRRVARMLEQVRCDHLVLYPRLVMVGFWERTFISFFMVMFNFRFRTWQAPWKWGWGYVGVGAFNMVRASVYEAIGRHEHLRLDVGDDIFLGKVIKRSGYRQCLGAAGTQLRVRWQHGLSGVVRGLEKNGFAGLGYSWLALAISCGGLWLTCVWPVFGAFIGPALAKGLCGATLLAMLAAGTSMLLDNGVSPIYTLAWPLAAALFSFILTRSAVLAESRGGIIWRGTRYSLKDLRKGRVR